MKKIFALFLLLAFVSVSFVLSLSAASAYIMNYDGYYGDYPTSGQHYMMQSADQSGSSYVSRDTYSGPQGDITVYRKVDDYPIGYSRPLYSAYSYRSYGNAMDNYWHNGPNRGYSMMESYRSGYADGKPYSNYYSHTSNSYPSYNRDYYYQPYYNGNYWDHSYNPGYYNCRGYYC